jgi:hypothetical protein
MVMINQLLVVIRDRIESVLQASNLSPERWVELANPVEIGGTTAGGLSNKIIMLLVSLQTDPTARAFTPAAMASPDSRPRTGPSVVLDGYLLIAPNFTGANYIDGLAMVSRIISYFQEIPILSAEEIPEMPLDCPRVAVEFVSLDFAEAHNLMTMVGIKCFPFLLYRLRGLSFDSAAMVGISPPVRGETGGAQGSAGS